MHFSDAALYYIPVQTRVPLVFGNRTVESVVVLRVGLTVRFAGGRSATGWGEVPLNTAWAWPDGEPGGAAGGETDRATARKVEILQRLAEKIATGIVPGECPPDPFRAYREVLEPLAAGISADSAGEEPKAPGARRQNLPVSAVRLVLSAFDLAVFDLFGMVHDEPSFGALDSRRMTMDLGEWVKDDPVMRRRLKNLYPAQVFTARPKPLLNAWHLVGGADTIASSNGGPDDDREKRSESAGIDVPRSLDAWVRRDGIDRVKVKLSGLDVSTAITRYLDVVRTVAPLGVHRVSVDFNGTLSGERDLIRFLEGVGSDCGACCSVLRMVEQPFAAIGEPIPAGLPACAADVLFSADESVTSWQDVISAHDARMDGVVLKTAKTLSEMIPALAVARSLEMDVFVQDLTNPMLALIAHAAFAGAAGGEWGVEVNATQFYPHASGPEEQVHPGLFRRRNGCIDISTITGPGIGYRIDEIARTLPVRAV